MRGTDDLYLRMIEEVQDYAIILLDENGIIQNWNTGAQKIKQYKEDEVIGKHFSVFYLPEDRATNLPEKILNEARQHGRAIHEGWRLRKDGTKFWGSITLTALHNDDEQVIGFTKVTRDLTEKKLADDQLKNFAHELQLSNEELRKSEERYHRMIAEIQDYAIILLDVDGNILNWNIGAQKIKGYTEKEIIGKNFRIFYTEEDRQKELPVLLLNQAVDTGKALHEGWRVTKEGTKFWGSIVITALHNEKGEVIGFSKVTRDLTEKKKSDDKLKEYLHDLQAQNEELDRFAYAASHDLQEPLRKIQIFADLIGQNLGDEAVTTKHLEKVTRASERMSMLIRSILEYSRLSKTADAKEVTDLNEILSNVMIDFELMLQQKNATIYSDKLPVISAIPLQVNQLFANLISNSLKYTDKEYPEIRITSALLSGGNIPHFSPDPESGNYCQIVFKDNGIGFESRYAQQIFTLFQRLHGKHEFHGTGIGLALCKKIMDNHGGRIFAEGEPGKGASFYIYFPTA